MKKDLRSENVKKIAEVFPMCITEIRDKDGNLKKVVDFEKLKELLTGELRDREEAYEFTWAGKREALHRAFEYNDKILRPVVEDSLNFFDTQNIYIEGDNLDVLRILRRSYFEKVKMIYIDPPYNTGHDFIYNDNFKKSKEDEEEELGLWDEEDNMLFENKESNGRFHSDWCSMIYSRLLLARDLLRLDGVIFISIDDNEVASLRKICDEVFGEDNFINIISRVMKSGGAKGRFFSPNMEYVLVYCRNIETVKNFREPISEEIINKLYTSIEEEGERKGERYRPFGLYQSSLDIRPNQRYYIECPDGTLVIPPGDSMPSIKKDGAMVTPKTNDGCWRWSKERYIEEKKKGNIAFKESKGVLVTSEGQPAKWNVYTKIWLKDRQEEGMVPVDLITKWENRIGTKELSELKIPFEFSKPSDLIKYLINIIDSQPNDIILDFFSGSATTAHAVMQLNAEDNGNRKYIMVQIPEKCDEKSEAYKAGYKNICEIGKERIRRAGKKIKEETNANIDYGFKVFKVDSSNFKEEISVPADEFDFKNLENCIENIKEDRTSLDLVYQCILSLGKELTLPIKIENIDGFTVYNVDNFSIMCCFDENISDEVMKYMADKEPEAVYFRDSCFRDSSHKLNVKEYFKVMSETTRFEDV